MAKLSPEARGFVARKIAANLSEGYDPKQAQAIAFSQARKQGYKIPPPPMIRQAEKMS